MEKVRVRFAPSPTGLLHIGGVRTAFINFLFARKNKGKFILRIEDTDVKRSTKEAVDAILDGLRWLGIEWDEGPFFQSERMDIYNRYLKKLIERDMVYPCFCTKEEIEREREEAKKKGIPYKYSGKCRNLSKEEREERIRRGDKYVWRFKVPEGDVRFKDLIKGDMHFINSVLDDFIIVRSDGIPVYNFSCVVDDFEMGITHVIRGEDHLSNTHKQILIYEALGIKPPEFGHLPLILGKDREKLSKRHGSVSVEEFKREGFLPEAIINYIFLLGFSLKGNKEIFSLPEMIDEFSIDKVSRTSSVFDYEKLRWINGYYIRHLSVEELLNRGKEFIPERFMEKGVEFVKRVLKEIQGNIKVLSDIPYLVDYFINEPIYEEGKIKEITEDERVLLFLKRFLSSIDKIEPFEANSIEKKIREILDEMGIKLKVVAQPLRYILTGRFASPPLFTLIELLGRETVKERIKRNL